MINQIFSLCMLLSFYTACRHSFDRNTKQITLAVSELTAYFILEAGDQWANYERNDGDFEWKDIAAEFWLILRDKYNLSDRETELAESEITQSLKSLKKNYQAYNSLKEFKKYHKN